MDAYITKRIKRHTEYNATTGKVYKVKEIVYYCHPYGFPVVYKVEVLEKVEVK